MATFGLNKNYTNMSDSKSFKEGRDTRNGRFVSVEKARNGDPDRYVVEHVPKPGHGDV